MASQISTDNVLASPTRTKKNVLASLPPDVLDVVLSYLAARSLCNLSTLNRQWQFDLDTQMDRIWRDLVARRWRPQLKHLRRTLGAANFKVAYQILVFRRRMPKGAFTEKHNKVFGLGHASGLVSWALVHHGAESRLQRRRGTAFITLRLCVQNVHHMELTLPLDRQGYEVQLRSEDESTIVVPVLGQPRIVAVNGVRTATPTPVGGGGGGGGGNDESNAPAEWRLRALDNIVVCIDVACPDDVVFETDFLSRVAHVAFTARATQPRPPHVPLSVPPATVALLVVNRFVDEEEVWQNYIELPGGVILLRAESDGVAQRSLAY